MKEEFKWGKFIVDCFVCFWLMIVSATIFSYPFAFIVSVVLKFIFGVKHFSIKIWCFGDMSVILLAACLVIPIIMILAACLVIPIIMIFLHKKNIIKYQFYKTSFIVCYMLLAYLILFIDYTLNCNFVK